MKSETPNQKECVMRKVQVESPFASARNSTEDIKRNIEYARACLHDCFLRGEAPFASHLLYTQPRVLNDDIPDERALGIKAGLVWGREADVTVVYTDFGISDGMKEGIKRAKEEGRPVEKRKLGGKWKDKK